jgi:hypothetical protein
LLYYSVIEYYYVDKLRFDYAYVLPNYPQ